MTIAERFANYITEKVRHFIEPNGSSFSFLISSFPFLSQEEFEIRPVYTEEGITYLFVQVKKTKQFE